MQETLKLQQKIVPEMIELLEKRYNILRAIYYNQPIGRRALANMLSLGERVVRTEIDFFKNSSFVTIENSGMYITNQGEEIIHKLQGFIHELKGLSEIEKLIEKKLGLKQVIIVPGDMEEDANVVNELGRTAAFYIKGIIKNGDTIALTGGSTVKKVVDCFPKIHGLKNVMIIPARGGMGKIVETQANTLVANLSNKLETTYKLLHAPDNLSGNALNSLMNESEVKELVDKIHTSNVLIYGIGRADEMAVRRGLEKEQIDELLSLGAVGEAFGYYFNRKGKIVFSTTTIGIRHDDVKKIKNLVAVAGGKNKADAIIAIELSNNSGALITDEGAARKIVNLLNE